MGWSDVSTASNNAERLKERVEERYHPRRSLEETKEHILNGRKISTSTDDEMPRPAKEALGKYSPPQDFYSRRQETQGAKK